MSDRRFEVSGLQIVASVLAALSGAVLASYLGVAGTIIGTAVMSIAGTAGTAIYKHYLGRTAGRLREVAPVLAAQRATEWMSTGVHDAARHPKHDEPAGHPTHGKPARQGRPAGSQPGRLARWWARVRGRPRWLTVAAAGAAVFVGVLGAVTAFEAAAGKPLQTVVWNHKASGTTVGNLVDSHPARSGTPAPRHVTPSSSAPASPAPGSSRSGSATPSPTPSTGSPSPTSVGSPPASGSASPAPTATKKATP